MLACFCSPLPQLSLELPGAGVMRLAGSPKEYSCASEGEENAALYNMACCWAALGQKQVRCGAGFLLHNT